MANLTGNDIQRDLRIVLRDIGDVKDDALLLWLNFADDFFYRKLTRLDPNRYLKTKTYYGSTTYTLPTDLNNFRTGNFYLTQSGAAYSVLSYDNKTGSDFVIGDTVIGSISGATGLILEDQDNGTTGYLTLTNVVGQFVDNEIIVGISEPFNIHADANGDSVPFAEDDNIAFDLNYGELQNSRLIPGFNLRGNTITVSDPNNIFQLIYIPNKIRITTLDQELTLDAQYENVFLDDIRRSWSRWQTDPAQFNWDEQIFINTLNELTANFPRTTRVMHFRAGSGQGDTRSFSDIIPYG